MDILELYDLRSSPYEYYVKLKNRYDYHIGDFGFRSVVDFLNAALDYQECACALCGKHEPYEPGTKERKQGRSWRYFEIDHDHLFTKMESVRGYLCPKCNTFLKPYDEIEDAKERQKFAEEWFGDKVIEYLTNPPFQQFLRECK